MYETTESAWVLWELNLITGNQTYLISTEAYGARKIGSAPTVAIVGALNVVMFLILAIFALTYPSLSRPTGALAFGVMGSVFLLGLVLFYVTRLYYKRTGLDTSLAFKEIPPRIVGREEPAQGEKARQLPRTSPHALARDRDRQQIR